MMGMSPRMIQSDNGGHHRAGTVDIPFAKTRKSGSGAWHGYPPF
jgi:hypothetical protein